MNNPYVNKMRDRNLPIDMLCFTDEEGNIEPLRFKVTGKDNTKSTYKIIKINKKEKVKYSGYQYLFYYAEVELNDRILDVVFKYDIEKAIWVLARY